MEMPRRVPISAETQCSDQVRPSESHDGELKAKLEGEETKIIGGSAVETSGEGYTLARSQNNSERCRGGGASLK